MYERYYRQFHIQYSNVPIPRVSAEGRKYRRTR